MHCRNIKSKVLRDEEPPGRSNRLLKGNKSIVVVVKQSTKIPVPQVATGGAPVTSNKLPVF